MMDAAKETQKWNEMPPKARPHRNRQELLQKYLMDETTMFFLNQQKQTQNLNLLGNTFVTGHNCFYKNFTSYFSGGQMKTTICTAENHY